MKRTTTILLAILLSALLVASVMAESSGEKRASAAIVTGGGVLQGIVVNVTSGVTLTVFDNASAASGTSLIPTWTIETAGLHSIGFQTVSPAACTYHNGIYVNVEGSGSVFYVVYYQPGR